MSKLERDVSADTVSSGKALVVPHKSISSAVSTPGSLAYDSNAKNIIYSNGQTWSTIASGANLTTVLAAGNSTGGSDIVITSGDRIYSTGIIQIETDSNSVNALTINSAGGIEAVASVISLTSGNSGTNSTSSGQVALSTSSTDGNAIFLNTPSGGMDIHAGDLININSDSDASMSAGGASVAVNNNRVTLAGSIVTSTTTTITGPGAVSTSASIVLIITTGAGNALTLADGVNGQRLVLIYTSEFGGTDTAVLTPATLLAGTTITFNNIGDTAELVFITTSGWVMISGSAVLA